MPRYRIEAVDWRTGSLVQYMLTCDSDEEAAANFYNLYEIQYHEIKKLYPMHELKPILEYDKKYNNVLNCNTDDTSISVCLPVFVSYVNSKTAGYSEINIDYNLRVPDVESVVRTLRSHDVEYFTISKSLKNLMEILAEFEKQGCILQGLVNIVPDTKWNSAVPALRFLVSAKPYEFFFKRYHAFETKYKPLVEQFLKGGEVFESRQIIVDFYRTQADCADKVARLDNIHIASTLVEKLLEFDKVMEKIILENEGLVYVKREWVEYKDIQVESY